MRFLITTDIASFRRLTVRSAHVDLRDPNLDLPIALVQPQPADVWICNGKEVIPELLDLWLRQPGRVSKILLVEDGMAVLRLQNISGLKANVHPFPPRNSNSSLSSAEMVLREAEVVFMRQRSQTKGSKTFVPQFPGATASKKVLMVGAGIVNLITAEHLAVSGFDVQIVDDSPDPRTCKDWSVLGTTSGGGNARMFTNTEADNYNEKGSEIYRDMRSIFRQTVREGGWSVKAPKDFTAAETAWIEAFEQVPPWLARVFREDIHAVNIRAGKIWRKMMKATPELFEEVNLRDEILRMYVEHDALDAALQLHRQLDILKQDTSLSEFLDAHPGFAKAATADHLAGGFTVDGFTVNIYPLMAKLIQRISGLGGKFTWNCRVSHIYRDSQGRVAGLDSQVGRLEADHYVLSPGVTGNRLLRGTETHDLIQGVLGVWLQIPNVNSQLQNSIKIHRRGHLVEDINVTVAKDAQTGEDVLMFGGGYGFVGLDRPSPYNPELMALFAELEEVARIYFPEGHAIAKRRGTLWPNGNYKYCVRPFTATGLGIFERLPTTQGGSLVITGGNNTGGFAQAPAIAHAVRKAVVEESDPIHILFHPDRGRKPTAVQCTGPPRIAKQLPILASTKSPQVLLLCSDGPQHRYFRHRLEKDFPGFRCIVETSEGQTRHLARSGRYWDAAWMTYHSSRRWLLGHDTQRKKYFDRLIPSGAALRSPDLTADSLNCRQVWDAVETWQPDLTIVSGTKYIGRKLTERSGLMINLHTGHLPDYKGNHCIFFALYDGAVSKVASTLHQLTPNLDGGDILDIVFPEILPSDNEETLYTRCMHAAMDRCLEHMKLFSNGEKLIFTAQKSTGAMYQHRDRTLAKEVWLWWAQSRLLRHWQESWARSYNVKSHLLMSSA